MSFIVIVVALALQFFLKFSSVSYQLHWERPYYQWMMKRFSSLTKWHDVFTVLLLVMPVVIIVSLFFTIVYHLLGPIGYLVISLALVWYCVDARDWRKMPSDQVSKDTLFLSTYQKAFAPLFWYFVFGPVGLVLYVTVAALKNDIAKNTTKQAGNLFNQFTLILGIFDWVPVRLLGLSFALVGHFNAVFKEWVNSLRQGIADDQRLIIVWGDIALKEQAAKPTPKATGDAAIQLIYRAMLVWLVVMALVTVT